MAGKTTLSTGKTKSEASKSDSKIPRTYRKSPSRVDASGDAKPAPKSPSRAAGGNKSPIKPKSPARTKSPVKAKSPARNKSPSRKSPAREKPSPPKSPARGRPRKNSSEMSGGKTSKSATQATSTPASKSKPVPVLTIDSDSDSDYAQDMSSEKPKARVQGRTRRATDISSRLIESAAAATHSSTVLSRASREDSAMRRSARLYNTGNVERTVHLKSHYEPIVKLSEFSDEDDVVHKTSKAQQSSSHGAKFSVFAILGNAIFTAAFPTIMIGLNAMCPEKNCKFQIPPIAPLLKLSTYYDPMTVISSLGFTLLVTVLSVLPFGGRVIKGIPSNLGQLTYCTNALFVTAVTLALAAVAQWYNVPLLPFIQQHWMHLNATFLVLCCLVAIMLYVKGKAAPLSQQNQCAMTSSALINFIEGKEINPRLFGVIDVKYVMYRTAFIAFILLNVLFTYASLSQPVPTINATLTIPSNVPWPLSLITSHINIQPTILTLTTMQLIYFLDMVVFERTFISSYEVQYAGTGLLKCFELLGGIFTYSLVGRYVLDNNVRLDWWKLVLSVLLFFVGYVFYRGSNLQKHTFRVNPYSPKISHYDSIPTMVGRKLLVSGYWGIVRHPNYLGDILIHLALLPFVSCAPPCLVLYLMTFSLIARAYTDNERCKAKYGASWDRYCLRVKYILVPKLY